MVWGLLQKNILLFFCKTRDPSESSPPYALTNHCCPCPLGSAAGNDFRCTADPSTFLAFKAFTNSPSSCTRGAKQRSQWSRFTRTTGRAERGSQSMQITGKPQRTIEEVHVKLLAMLEDPRQPHGEIPWSIEQRVECAPRQERQRSQK